MDIVSLETLNDWLVRRHSPEFGLPYWHGCLTGIVCAPDLVPPSEWMPQILGTDDDDAPDLTAEEMERVTGLIMELYNETCAPALGTRFKPHLSSVADGLKSWCCGFMDEFLEWFDDVSEEEWEETTWLIMPMMILSGREAFLKVFEKKPDEKTLRELEQAAPDAVRKNVPLLRKLFMTTRGPDNPG
jgi:yecA family protein